MEEFAGSDTRAVVDVDCTADGKSLCEKFSVGGYPTLKYGDPADMQDYNGGRTFDEMKTFVEESLGPACGPGNLDLCDEKKRKSLETFMKMTEDRLEGKMRNAVRVVEEDVPLMKKVIAHLKASGDAKSEL